MATTNENKGFYKLSWLQRIGFGSGDLAQNLIFQTTCMYLLFFYTDIYGLDAVDVSVMFTVGNVVLIWYLSVSPSPALPSSVSGTASHRHCSTPTSRTSP